MNKHEKRNACRRFNSIIVFVFIAFILFNILRPLEDFSTLENRYLKKISKPTVSEVLSGEFSGDIEEYTNDRFFARNFLLKLKSKFEYALGKKENNGVIICNDGSLIEKQKAYNEELVYKNCEDIITFTEKGGFNVLVSAIAPAFEVRKESLPKNSYNDNAQKINSCIEKCFSGKNIKNVNPTELLRKHSEDYIYFKTDPHLTSNGGYVMYHALADALGYTTLSGDDFKISDISREFLGENYSKTLKKTTPDILVDYRPLETPRFKVEFPAGGEEADSMYFPSHLIERNKYAYFLDGNHPLTIIKSPNKNGKTIAIVKDSYANTVVPFIANHFETIHMIDLKEFDGNAVQYIKLNNIEDVLILCGLQNFNYENSFEILKK